MSHSTVEPEPWPWPWVRGRCHRDGRVGRDHRRLRYRRGQRVGRKLRVDERRQRIDGRRLLEQLAEGDPHAELLPELGIRLREEQRVEPELREARRCVEGGRVDAAQVAQDRGQLRGDPVLAGPGRGGRRRRGRGRGRGRGGARSRRRIPRGGRSRGAGRGRRRRGRLAGRVVRLGGPDRSSSARGRTGRSGAGRAARARRARRPSRRVRPRPTLGRGPAGSTRLRRLGAGDDGATGPRPGPPWRPPAGAPARSASRRGRPR